MRFFSNNMINYADDIKRAVTATEMFRYYGFEINRGGYVCCPFHHEKTPSLKVYPGDGGWKCYGCGAGNSVIDFVMQYFDLSFADACAKINTDFNLGFPIGKTLSLREYREAEQAARERKQKAEAEKAEHERLKIEYQIAYDQYALFDKQRMDYHPDSVGYISPEYAAAVSKLPLLDYRLSQAEMRLYEYEHNRPRYR